MTYNSRFAYKVDKQYLDSGVWKCHDAPINEDFALQVAENSGAHYWLEFGAGRYGEFYCKYCYTIKKFGTKWNGGKAEK